MKKLLMKEIELGRKKALKNASALIKDADILCFRDGKSCETDIFRVP